MRILGIVAEYDPFHNGHLHHLQAAVSAVSPDATVVVQSAVFKQRGEASLFSPFDRAACAAAAGADAVVALPVCWTVRDAEHYAIGAVSLLASLGATHLAFGAETADLPLLRRTAELLENPPAALRESLRETLSSGLGFPASLAKAASLILPECGRLLNHPNNILAVCYLRAILRGVLSVTPVVIPRYPGYHADQIDSAAPSASAVRHALCRGSWEDALSALPPASAAAVRASFLSGRVPDSRKLDAILLDALRGMDKKQAARLPDCPEGLDAALLNAAARADSREQLTGMLTTRRYPSARISRLCACALLGITADHLSGLSLPDTALLLAMRKNPSLTGSWKNSPVRICCASDWRKSADPADLRAWRVWGQCAGLPADWPFSQRLPVLP